MIQRESVYAAWQDLSFEIQSLGAVVQNPTTTLGEDDVLQWASAAEVAEHRLRSLIDTTKRLLKEKSPK